jgi:hypothetical protein
VRIIRGSGRLAATLKVAEPLWQRQWSRRHRRAPPAFAAIAALVLVIGCTASPPSQAPAPEAAAPQGLPASEPVNVGLAKLAAIAYHDSGAYMRDLALAAAPANDWLRQRAPQTSRPALVLDVDDTALTNWPVILANDFGRFATGPCLLPPGPCGWHAWDLLGRDAAIGPTLQVFQSARSLGVTVFFISGRPESERAATEENLRAVGYRDYAEAFFTPNGAHFASLVQFKAPVRARIAAMGYTIIANIGDQFSDLEGGFAERSFKLPNPFYYIP